MAIHSSILAWRIPWTEEPGRLYNPWACFICVRLCVAPWTAAHRAPLPMGFSRQEYWSGLPLPSPCSHQKSLILGIVIIRKQSSIFYSVSFYVLFCLVNAIMYCILVLFMVTSGIKPFFLTHTLNSFFPTSVFLLSNLFCFLQFCLSSEIQAYCIPGPSFHEHVFVVCILISSCRSGPVSAQKWFLHAQSPG